MVLALLRYSMNQWIKKCMFNVWLIITFPGLKKESGKTNIDYILQEDNAPCHVGAYSRWFKMKTMTNTFDRWPSQSPDLNPIENVCAFLRNHLDEIDRLSELERVLKKE